MKINSLYLLFCLFFIQIACTDESPNPNTDCTGIVASYNATVKGILDGSCGLTGCHKSPNPTSGIDFTTYDKAKIGALSSNFICAINHSSGCKPMPDGGPKLSDVQIKILECWVQNGTPL